MPLILALRTQRQIDLFEEASLVYSQDYIEKHCLRKNNKKLASIDPLA